MSTEPTSTEASQREANHREASERRRHFILGTAGHIDHGKTSLIRALTGTDTDRLPEEKRRGMTIELGFASLHIGDLDFGVVDVPGHEKFVRMMVAGASGIDVALIVVAADDSVMPQTVEHVDILHLLGVRRAVVAVTKIDTVDPDMVDLVADDVRSLLADTDLADSPICPVSSTEGTGIDALRDAIAAQTLEIPPRPLHPPFYLAVDRVFTVHGRGTVVTGSALRGSVSAGDELQAWPSGDTCKVRDLQSHGSHEESLHGGQRSAINISGLDRSALQRGCVLATPEYLERSHVVGVRLQVLASARRPLKSTETVRLCVGTTELPARVVLLDRTTLEGGAGTYAQLRCGLPLVSIFGQRFIIRDENATRTIGGGRVLQPVTRRRRTRHLVFASLEGIDTGDDADRVEAVLREAGLVPPTDLQLCAGAGVELDALPDILKTLETKGRWITIRGTSVRAVPSAIDDIKHRVLRRLERFHGDNPNTPGRSADTVTGWLDRLSGLQVGKALLDRFLSEGVMKRFGRFICLPKFSPKLSAAEQSAFDSLVSDVRSGRFQPPTMDVLGRTAGVDRKRLDKLATLAVASELLVRIDGKIYLHTDLERELCSVVADLIDKHDGVTVAQVREALGSSRKYVVPFMEYLDRKGFTRRVGDRRVLAAGATV